MLQHLKHLTREIKPGIFCPAIYAHLEDGTYVPHEAKDEGMYCVDDAARASILAFEYGDVDQALQWLTFLTYMTRKDGKVANFADSEGTINEHGDTSFRGGQWWQARAVCAYAKAYRETRGKKWLDLYWTTARVLTRNNITDNRIMALVNLARRDINKTGTQQIRYQTPGLNYYRMGETWGYHQLLEGTLAKIDDVTSLTSINVAISDFIIPMVKAGFYYNWKSHTKEGLCAYNVGPIVQGLAAYYHAFGTHKELLEASYNWFYGQNDEARIIYDAETGRCFDGLTSEDAGAESSIQAGLAELAVRKAVAK